jgi:hypothetical protein
VINRSSGSKVEKGGNAQTRGQHGDPFAVFFFFKKENLAKDHKYLGKVTNKPQLSVPATRDARRTVTH